MECCPFEIIAISFDFTADQLLAIGDDPKTWATLRTEAEGLIAIEAVQLELDGFDPTTYSLAIFADEQRQVSQAGRARAIWFHQPSYLTGTPPSWLIPGPTLTGGHRAECRLPVTMAARNLRLWTNQRDVTLTVSGTVFYRS